MTSTSAIERHRQESLSFGPVLFFSLSNAYTFMWKAQATRTRLRSVSNSASQSNLFGFVSPELFDQIYHFPKDDKASELVTSVKEERRNQPITIPLVQDSASWVTSAFPFRAHTPSLQKQGFASRTIKGKKRGRKAVGLVPVGRSSSLLSCLEKQWVERVLESSFL